ncbi:glycine zipper 2TM domain-containing protein, partial [Rhodoferax sp.]|uniref:beta/gamma crystallin-related protein n=1 Tax=Rhodoferax sp. TaxID=50421 RepID=UPI00271B2305
FRGRCVVLRPGQYPSMRAMGLNDRVSSVRAVSRDAHIDDDRYAPASVVAPDYRRRNNEHLFEANITSVRAVVGTPEQRCWVEPGQVAQTQGTANIPGAIAGALIGGILGHQVGGGSGKDIATAGGVIAGAAIGANIGRTQQAATQDVQRCESIPNRAQAQYWDVSYTFRGQEHRTQMNTPPGSTVMVNEQGEPRN